MKMNNTPKNIDYLHIEEKDNKKCFIFTPKSSSSLDTFFKKIWASYPLHLIIEKNEIKLVDDTGYGIEHKPTINKLCSLFKINENDDLAYEL